MALATQCPHCYTSFRVANDQLKLHAGLVRCGACQQTFNGVEYLLAPGTKPAVPGMPVAAQAKLPIAPTAPVAPQFNTTQIPLPDATVAEQSNAAAFDAQQSETTYIDLNQPNQLNGLNTPDKSYATMVQSSNALDFDLGDAEPVAPVIQSATTPVPHLPNSVDDNDGLGLLTQVTLINRGSDDVAELEPSLDEPAAMPARHERMPDIANETQSTAQALPKAEPAPEFAATSAHAIEDIAHTEIITAYDTVSGEDDAVAPAKAWNAAIISAAERSEQSNTEQEEDKPAFVIQAEKKQRRSRGLRIFMIIGSILLFISLMAQSTYLLRNHIVAWFPQSKPVLQQACTFLKCRIELLTQIEAISIESNELQALSTDKNVFFLAIQLQNKSGTLQAWPMLELILNDAKDKPVVHRTFTPADYLANKTDLIKGFAPKSEQTVKLYFEMSGSKAAGYHVGVYYP